MVSINTNWHLLKHTDNSVNIYRTNRNSHLRLEIINNLISHFSIFGEHTVRLNNNRTPSGEPIEHIYNLVIIKMNRHNVVINNLHDLEQNHLPHYYVINNNVFNKAINGEMEIYFLTSIFNPIVSIINNYDLCLINKYKLIKLYKLKTGIKKISWFKTRASMRKELERIKMKEIRSELERIKTLC